MSVKLRLPQSALERREARNHSTTIQTIIEVVNKNWPPS
ncbi:hypothetical protein SFK218_1026 [Shigella flexneri K-218]|nr:hypothetical protein SFK218_1338 [Shigella flexneri K-218]EGK26744.1 hypothetical protein SFK218_1026 [Shigella flexneri K-218]